MFISCENLGEAVTFKSSTKNKVLKIKHNMTCDYDTVIYLCEYKLCEKQHVVKSEVKLKHLNYKGESFEKGEY